MKWCGRSLATYVMGCGHSKVALHRKSLIVSSRSHNTTQEAPSVKASTGTVKAESHLHPDDMVVTRGAGSATEALSQQRPGGQSEAPNGSAVKDNDPSSLGNNKSSGRISSTNKDRIGVVPCLPLISDSQIDFFRILDEKIEQGKEHFCEEDT